MYKEGGDHPNFAMGMMNGRSWFWCGGGPGFEQLQLNYLPSILCSGAQKPQFPTSYPAILNYHDQWNNYIYV